MSPKRRECPKPEKRKFKTGDKAAGAALRLLRDRNITRYIYECECGYWHFTKQKQDVVYSVPEPSLQEAERLVARLLDINPKVIHEMIGAKLRRLLVGEDDS